jgi:hypothetical protein
MLIPTACLPKVHEAVVDHWVGGILDLDRERPGDCRFNVDGGDRADCSHAGYKEKKGT